MVSLAKSKNFDYWLKACELLVESYSLESEKILYHLTFDKSYVVRLNAIDSLCIEKTLQSLQRLNQLMDDSDYLIRGYAVMSFYDVNINIYNVLPDSILKELETKCLMEENNWVKAILYRTLYINGNICYFEKLVELFNNSIESKDYEVIWCLLSVMNEIVGVNNKVDVAKMLKSLKINVLPAQREKIDLILAELDQ